MCTQEMINHGNTVEINNELEIDEKTTENINDTEEHYSDERILVHISGAVNKEGIVELKINSRISDAIDKARRITRRCLY